MKRKIASIIVVLLSIAAIAAAPAPGQRVKYEMTNCPSYLAGQTDELGNPVCSTPASMCSRGTCNRVAPSTDAGQGMSLQGLSAFRVTVCAAKQLDGGNPEVLMGDGGILLYGWNNAEAQWVPDPELNKSQTVTGNRCQLFPDFSVGGQFDRVAVTASNIWVQLPDGGATDAGLDILIDGQSTQGQHWN